MTRNFNRRKRRDGREAEDRGQTTDVEVLADGHRGVERKELKTGQWNHGPQRTEDRSEDRSEPEQEEDNR